MVDYMGQMQVLIDVICKILVTDLYFGCETLVQDLISARAYPRKTVYDGFEIGSGRKMQREVH